MKSFIDGINIILPVLYLAAAWIYGTAFFQDTESTRKLKTPALVILLLLHSFYLVARTILFNHPPITSVFEILTVVAFALAASYRIIEFQTQIKNTGFFILSLAFLFQVISSFFIVDLLEVKPVLQSHLLGFHVLSAISGFSAFAISAVYGVLYLMLYHNLKKNQFGLIYEKLPNLEKLERMAVVAVTVGFVLLTIAILVGSVWLPRAIEHYSFLDPKFIGTVITWFVYGAGLLGRRSFGWKGRRIMVLSITGFTVSFLSLTFINMFLSGFHNFF
jgi:ABC-type transport system involved in cytochrome c biogenesis permease subunit